MKLNTHAMLAEMLEAPRPRLSTCVLNLPYRGPHQTLKSLQAQTPHRTRRMLDLRFTEKSLDKVFADRQPCIIRPLAYFAFRF